MLLTPHLLTGAAIGSATGNQYVGLMLGILSHHILDAILHFDLDTFRVQRNRPNYLGATAEHIEIVLSLRDWAVIAVDTAAAALILGTLFLGGYQLLSIPILAGMLGAILPDVLDSSPLWSPQLRARYPLLAAYHRLHAFFHWTATKDQIFLGLATQVLCIGAALWVLLR